MFLSIMQLILPVSPFCVWHILRFPFWSHHWIRSMLWWIQWSRSSSRGSWCWSWNRYRLRRWCHWQRRRLVVWQCQLFFAPIIQQIFTKKSYYSVHAKRPQQKQGEHVSTKCSYIQSRHRRQHVIKFKLVSCFENFFFLQHISSYN